MDTESTWAKVYNRRTLDLHGLWFITIWTLNLHELRFITGWTLDLLRLWFITVWTLNLQGVSRNIPSSTFFQMYDSWNNYPRVNNYKIPVVLAFPKCGLPVLFFKHYRRYLEFRSDFPFIYINQNCRNLNEILNIYIQR